MRGEVIHAGVAESATSPDIGMLTYGTELVVSLSKHDDGTFLVSIEAASDEPAQVTVEINGGDAVVFQGELSS